MTNDETKRVPKKRAGTSSMPAKAVLAAAAQKSSDPKFMSERDLANLGGGKVAYIKMMTTAEAKAMFPAVQGMPQGINLYSVHAADGTPLALTDSMSAAIGHAMGDELQIATLH